MSIFKNRVVGQSIVSLPFILGTLPIDEFVRHTYPPFGVCAPAAFILLAALLTVFNPIGALLKVAFALSIAFLFLILQRSYGPDSSQVTVAFFLSGGCVGTVLGTSFLRILGFFAFPVRPILVYSAIRRTGIDTIDIEEELWKQDMAVLKAICARSSEELYANNDLFMCWNKPIWVCVDKRAGVFSGAVPAVAALPGNVLARLIPNVSARQRLSIIGA